MRPWTDKIIIDLDNQYYSKFHFFIQFLCLISSFYYGSIAGIRYSEYDSFSVKNLVIMSLFEVFFAIHLIMQFFVAYKLEGKHVIRDIPAISSHYL